MNTQPQGLCPVEALRLAHWLEHHGDDGFHPECATELRRLFEACNALQRICQERFEEMQDLYEANHAMLEALKKFSEYEAAMDAGNDIDGMLLYAELQAMSRAAIAKGEQQ